MTNMTPDELNEDPAPDLGPEEDWVTVEVTDAINALVDALYSAGASVNGVQIIIPTIPGEDYTVHSDYGDVQLIAKDSL